jgi:amidase
MGSTQPQTWQDIVSRKRAIRDVVLKPYLVDDLSARAPRVKDVDERSRVEKDPKVQQITDIDNLPALRRYIHNGTFSAEEVVLAYIKR